MVLDKALEDREIYEAKRLARIEVLVNRSKTLEPVSLEMYDTNLQLYREYQKYQCDSAISYLNRNMEIVERLKNRPRLFETKLLLSSFLELSGLYKESVDVLESIDRNELPERHTLDYLYNYRQAYRALAYYTKDKRQAVEYTKRAAQYNASLSELIGNMDDDTALMIRESALLDAGEYEQAALINDLRLSKAEKETPEYAMIAYDRAMICRGMNDRETEKYYLALSAVSDVKSAIKDYASLWMLAELLFDEGHVNRAYNYIRISWADILFFNARLRGLQTAEILTMIDETYEMRLQENNETLHRYTLFIGFLAVLLVVSLFFLYIYTRRLRAVRNDLEKMNGRLKELNDELKQANDSLRLTNGNLSESNLIKEKYIGRFLNLCSGYIDKLDAYRRMTYKKIRDGQVGSLLQITASQESLNADLKELYTNFDSTFLQLFPNFVSEFNKLLHDDEAIVPRKDELLNTELRIFALIRLGIEDSSCIAEFLRYSLNTIYNYRAKVRNKAKVSRDKFEDMVKQIR